MKHRMLLGLSVLLLLFAAPAGVLAESGSEGSGLLIIYETEEAEETEKAADAADTGERVSVSDEEYPELISGGLTKEQFEVVLAYVPSGMRNGEISAQDFSWMLQDLAMDASIRNGIYTDDFNALTGVAGSEGEIIDYGFYYDFNYEDLNRFLSVLTGGSLTQEMVSTGNAYDPIISADLVSVLIGDGDGGYYSTASITDCVLTGNGDLFVTYDVVSTAATMPDLTSGETLMAKLIKNADGVYVLDQTGYNLLPSNSSIGTGEAVLPSDFPVTLSFSSGAGAWADSLVLYPDGSFEGFYHDWDGMGVIDGVEVQGVYYLCSYSGTFTDIAKIDDHTWSLTLEEISYDDPLGETWIDDNGNHCLVVEPYGLEGGKQFYLYDPTTPLEGLNDDFLMFWPGYFYSGNDYETLSCWGLFNEELLDGFFSQIGG